MGSGTLLKSTKNHLHILDGLRGVAAIVVLLIHLLEGVRSQISGSFLFGHGYLAVDFFFMLSGFVIAYAYDSRWDDMSIKEFLVRRVIRLQPMIVLGSALGALLFYAQKSPSFHLIANTSPYKVFLFMLLGMALLPARPAWDIRGGQFSFPLNAAQWSLFFEYIANLLYALWLRKVSNRTLVGLSVLAGLFLVYTFMLHPGAGAGAGTRLNRIGLQLGFARLFFPFFTGILLQRLHKRIHVRYALLWTSLLLVFALAMPVSLGHPYFNPLFDGIAIIIIFPLIVLLGAGSDVSGTALRTCRYFGDISYPLYLTHWPIVCVYIAWVSRDHPEPAVAMSAMLLTACICIVVAHLSLKLFDNPARRWMTRWWTQRAAA